MKRKILILYAGGTIGMQASEHGYVPVSGFEQLLRDQLRAGATQQLPDFEVQELDQLIDSSNLQPAHWSELSERLISQWRDYDGFIILHGTDTMAYSASALSFILQGIDKPVIVTGSQIPLSELRNDAQDNLITALILAGNYDIAEVCIYFNGRLLRGNRSSKLKSTGFDAFDTPNYPWLAQVGIHIDLHPNLLQASGSPDFIESGYQVPEFNPDAVVVLPVYPGLSARVAEDMLNHSDVKGLILLSYGVGNPPDANAGLMSTLERAVQSGVTVLNVTQCLQGRVSQGAYATGATLNRIGVVPGSDLTLEAAFTKLHYLIATQPAEAIAGLMQQSLCGELSE